MAWTHQIYCVPSSASYWAAQSAYSDTITTVAPGETQYGFSKCQLVFNRGVEDVAVIDLSFTALPGGGITSVLDPATHMPNAETALNTWWTAVRSKMAPNHTLASFRWYQYHAATTKPGPAVRITSVGTAGTDPGTPLPYQMAATTTFRTCARRHWGRVYLPGLTSSSLQTSGGRFTTAYCDAWAGAFQALVNNVHAYNWGDMVVASVVHRGIMAIAQLDTDDVPDVQRRRRVAVANYEKVYSS